MSVESDVYDELVGDATYNAIVEGRVYAGHVPGGTAYPHSDIALISEAPIASNGMEAYRVQVSNRSTDYGDTRDMRDAIRSIVNSVGHWQIVSFGPDIVGEDGAAVVYMLPVDLMIYKGV